jgi:hypothetical protein
MTSANTGRDIFWRKMSGGMLLDEIDDHRVFVGGQAVMSVISLYR